MILDIPIPQMPGHTVLMSIPTALLEKDKIVFSYQYRINDGPWKSASILLNAEWAFLLYGKN